MTAPTREELSLLNCDKEPVHIPGRIQDFSVLLATDARMQIITHCSANAQELFGPPTADILNAPLQDIIGKQAFHDVRNALSLGSSRVQRERACSAVYDDSEHEIWVHFSDGLPVIEIERCTADNTEQMEATLAVRSLLGRLQSIENIQ